MLLEKCGKLFFSKMNPLFFFLLALLPLAIAAYFLYQQSIQLQDLEKRFASAKRKERLAMQRKERKEAFLQRYSHANPYFLDQNIESITLLEKEKKKLESFLNHPAFPVSLAIQDRLAFLKKNQLAFQEEKITSTSQMKEVEEKQRFSVQVDETDLKRILSLIEDVPIDHFVPEIHTPQILITQFHLKKCETPLHSEVFEIEMDLLKREFSP